MASKTKRESFPVFPLRAVTCAEALEHGVTDWQLRDTRLERPFRGVRVSQSGAAAIAKAASPAPALSPAPSAGTQAGDKPLHPAQVWRNRHLELAHAYHCLMKPGEYFSGLTAALIWELPVPIHPGSPQRIEVAAVAPRAAPRRVGVKGVQISPRLMGTATRQGLATIDAPTIWSVLGPRLGLSDRVALGDAIIRRPRIGGNLGPPPRRSHATIEELIEISGRRGLRGKASLQEALSLLRTGSASAPESHLRLALVAAGLPEPALDIDVYDERGQYLGTTECVYPEFKVALEYEGDHHRTLAKQWNRDIDKQDDYEEAGWAYIRITAEKFYRHRAMLMDKVRRTLLARGWQS